MIGRLSECLLLAYRVRPDAVRQLLPAGLELVTYGGHAFWNVVACRVEKMRPAGLPALCGLSYNHLAYRLYVRAAGVQDQTDGLFFVRSDAGSRLISAAGNVMTDFRFHASEITLRADDARITWTIRGDVPAQIEVEEAGAVESPPGSPFDSPDNAGRFLKYRPVALSVSRRGRLKLTTVHRHEPDWRERRVRVLSDGLPFLDGFGPHHLELATRVDPLDYRWVVGGSPV
jgi:hypothetical protein